ncbi:MAG: CZB domain-containing protein [Candidatus Micrarchaeota archaeon]
MRDIINEAIISHMRWKQLLDEAIETGESKFTVKSVNSDKNCILGKWLNYLDSEHKKEYCKIKEIHMKFHKCAARVLKLALEGKRKKAKKATEKGSRYSLYSTKLIEMLAKLNEKTIVV